MKQALKRPARFVLALAMIGSAAALLSNSLVEAAAARLADPTADEVLAKAVEAVGGADAVSKINNLRTVMNMSMQGMTMEVESCWSRAGGRLAKTKVPMGGSTMETSVGTDGKVAWRKMPAGYELLSEKDARQLEHQTGGIMNMLDPERVKAGLESIENTGKQTFADKESWKLHSRRKDGTESDMFFDVTSGMPMGFESVEKQGDVEIRSRGVFSDWKEQEGVKFFNMMTVETSAQASPIVMKVTTIEINKLDDKVFALPDEVKKLADAAGAKGGKTDAEPAKEIKIEDLTPEQRKTAEQALEGMRQIKDPAQQKMMVQRMESVIPMMPANEQLPMKYAIQELKKEMAKAGG